MIVVSNTSPLTNLAAIGQLDVLRQIHQRVIIAEAVYRELMADGGSHPGGGVQSLFPANSPTINHKTKAASLRRASGIALAIPIGGQRTRRGEHVKDRRQQ